MCKYCDLKKNECKDWFRDDAPAIYLIRKNKYYYIFTVDERQSDNYKIHFCPFCGRKLDG